MVYIIAHFANNLGDDLFIRHLLSRYPYTQFYLCASNPSFLKCFSSYRNAQIINPFKCFLIKVINKIIGYRGPFRDYKAFKKATAVVRIGGSIFIETDGWKERFSYSAGENLFIIGSNFGPYYSAEYKNAVERIIEKSIDCCFRDRFSYETFKHLKHTRFAPDILFGYEDESAEGLGNYIGISVIDFSNRKHLSELLQLYETGIINICNYFLSKGNHIKLFSFCVHEGDNNAINRIKDKLTNQDCVEIVQYSGDVDSFLHEFQSCSTIIATRFHSMILGWKYKKKVLPVIYSEKMLHVIQDLNFDGIYWNVFAGAKAPIDALDVIKPLDAELLAKMVAKSSDHFKVLDDFLKRRS